jgi:hypothetical protein
VNESVNNCEELVVLDSGPSRKRLPSQISPLSSPTSSCMSPPVKKPANVTNMNSFVIHTTRDFKENIDNQVARYLFATNTPFKAVEHPEFKTLLSALRPGYVPPSREAVAGKLLDNVYLSILDVCQNMLQGKDVCMSLDGWSNVRNEPIVCICVTTNEGKTYPIKAIDTSGHSHTAVYLQGLATNAILECQNVFKCHVRSLVTDNAANVAKMRSLLERDNNLHLICYGCSAHLLNLLAHDVVDQFQSTKDGILKVIKFFRCP